MGGVGDAGGSVRQLPQMSFKLVAQTPDGRPLYYMRWLLVVFPRVMSFCAFAERVIGVWPCDEGPERKDIRF